MTDSRDMELEERAVRDIVIRAQEGDQESIGELFERFSDRIYRYVRFRVSDEAATEDITQTVFLEMVRSLSRYRPRRNAKFSTWLF